MAVYLKKPLNLGFRLALRNFFKVNDIDINSISIREECFKAAALSSGGGTGGGWKYYLSQYVVTKASCISEGEREIFNRFAHRQIVCIGICYQDFTPKHSPKIR